MSVPTKTMRIVSQLIKGMKFIILLSISIATAIPSQSYRDKQAKSKKYIHTTTYMR